MIKLLIADDSNFIRVILKELLGSETGINIVGEAADGREALDKVLELHPDVVLLDIVMPPPDGLWALEEINRQHPTPVIIFSSFSPNESEIAAVSGKLGAIGVVHKPHNPEELYKVKQELIVKIKAAALVGRAKPQKVNPALIVKAPAPRAFTTDSVIAIGSSAGGPPALRELLHALPANLGSGVLIAQHMPDSFIKSFSVHLRDVTKMSVKIAEDGDLVTGGRILVSPASKTLTVHKLNRSGVVRLVDVETRPRPSIDAMFESAACVYGRNCAGVVLSGMGSDGTRGLKAIKDAGGRVFAQDKQTSSVWGMPKSAVESGVVSKGMPVSEIARELVKC